MDMNKIKEAMQELDEETLLAEMNAVISEGGSVQDALAACQTGMEVVGQRFDEGEYFVGDLIFAGEIMTEAVDILRPGLGEKAAGGIGRMIVCTVRGDMHDIGKNIVKALLEAGGLDVLDLGVDVEPALIVETAQKENIRIIALSGVLTLSLDAMKETVAAFETTGLRDGVKIIIGGAPVNENACAIVGADAWAQNPQKTVSVCQSWAKALA